jgi:hypothetical protein
MRSPAVDLDDVEDVNPGQQTRYDREATIIDSEALLVDVGAGS